MKTIPINELQQFQRKYRFSGSRLLRVSLRHGRQGTSVRLVLRVRPASRELGANPVPVRLMLHIEGVEEYRFLKRMNSQNVRVHDLNIGVFNGVIFLSLDSLNLLPGDIAGVHDYRLSDAYAAGSRLSVQEMVRPGS